MVGKDTSLSVVFSHVAMRCGETIHRTSGIATRSSTEQVLEDDAKEQTRDLCSHSTLLA